MTGSHKNRRDWHRSRNEKHSIEAFIFDMDGTLVDNMMYHNKAWLTVLSETGISILH
jgi:trehalose-6-phosphatase